MKMNMLQENIEGFELSPQQKHLWLLQSTDSGFPYRAQCKVLFEGHVNLDTFKEAMERVVNRHEILRTNFKSLPEMKLPLQIIGNHNIASSDCQNLSALSPEEQAIEIEALWDKMSQLSFDITSGTILHWYWAKLSANEHLLILTIPALCADTIGLKNLVHEIIHCYSACLNGEKIADEPIQYVDISSWQNELIKAEDREIGRAYWRNQNFTDCLAFKLPFENKFNPESEFVPRSLSTTINSDTAASLIALVKEHNISTDVLLLACWQILLCRLTGQQDIVVGTAFDGRKHEELQESIGLLVKYLPVRCHIEESFQLGKILKQVHQLISDAHTWQEYFTWSQIQDRDNNLELDYLPFSFDFEQLSCQGSFADISYSINKQYACCDRFKLKFSCLQQDDALIAEFNYDENFFSLDDIKCLAGQFQTLLTSVVNNPQSTIGDLEIISDVEQQKLLVEFNDTQTHYPHDKCIHKLFEEQVERTPEAVAVVFEKEHLTYKELNNRANRLAQYLKTLGVKAETLVGICLERSLEMIVAILGVLKADGAYVPLDPEYPERRLAFILEDTQAPVIITQSKFLTKISNEQAKVICLDADSLGEASALALKCNVKASNLAYVIYTSGSTGKPKGVMVTHQNLVHSTSSRLTYYSEKTLTSYLLLSSFAFDSSVAGIFWTLCQGGKLVLPQHNEQRDPVRVRQLIAENQVSHLLCLPSLYALVLEQAEPQQLGSLSTAIVAGESCPLKLIELHNRRLPLASLFNEYGPTEVTVWSSVYKCQYDNEKKQVPIGHPIANIQIYILDSNLELVPIGVPGELHIGGAGLARGYLNRPELTTEKFISNPFSDDLQARLYKTGDLARYLPDGNIEYIGRIDNQVKIRGFRIELGEIDAVLSQHPNVQQAVTIAREDTSGDKRLVAYLVSDVKQNPSINELQQFLKKKLPEYMVPAAFVYLDALPLTPNGKVDRRVLPIPDLRQQLALSYEAPRTSTEETLANIWADVLKVEQVGIYDNFFDIGGDSILSIQVQSQAQKKGLQFSLQQLFQYQTVRELASNLEVVKPDFLPKSKTEPFSLIPNGDRRKLPDDVEDAYPLSMVQAGAIFHLESGSHYEVYNQSVRLQVGSDLRYKVYNQSIRLRGRFEPESFQKALQLLVNRHAILRTSFELTNFSEPLQLVHRTSIIPLEVEDLRYLDFTEQEDLLNAWLEIEEKRKFDWKSYPFIRLCVHRLTEETFQLTFSYLFLDGWSSASMITELAHYYTAFLRGETPVVETPPKTSYRDFVALERMALKSDESQHFWSQKLIDCNPTVLSHWPSTNTQNSKNLPFRIPVPIARNVLEGLKKLAGRASVPLKSILLAGHLRVVSLLSGQSDVITGLVVNGRPEAEDGDRVLGLFLNFLPLRLDLLEGTWTDLVKATFAAECELSPHRRYPFAELHRHNGRQLQFETIFNFVNFHIYQSLEELSEIEFLDDRIYPEQSFFPLGAYFALDPFSSELTLYLDVHTSDLCDEQLEAIAKYYLSTFTQMANDPDERYEFLSLLPADEKRQLLVEWNDTETHYPQDKCIYELFEEQVERTPDAVAVVFEERQLTYSELNNRANQLARYLKKLGVKAETLVGICLERSLEMVVGLLAILKAGGAYVPLDPNYPSERLAYILSDAQISVMLTQECLQIPKHDTQIVYLDTDWSKIAACSEFNFLSNNTTAKNLAYVIYTSGSTGEPKGVQVLHRSIVNFLVSMNKHLELTNQDILLSTTSMSFDIAVLEIFLPISLGSCLVLVSREIASDGLQLSDYLVKSGATVMQATPATWQLLLNAGWHSSQSLKILCGGETLSQKLADQLLDRGSSLWNLYGPTETTIWSSIYRIESKQDSVLIGKPISNTQIYILDSHLQPVPIGVPGELHIGGAGLARGYLNRPELTTEKFISNPFSDDLQARLYKTGDLARYLPDGNIEYIGRIDNQVKIRGFRIELGEIDAVLSQHPNVQQAVTIAREDTSGDKRLVAYLVSDVKQNPSINELQQFLKKKLPEYMVPAAFVYLDALPLTPNGKVDRRVLPIPDLRQQLALSYEAPRTSTEETLANIWADVLKVEQVGIYDNFFDLGGHSLLVTQLTFKMREIFQVELPLHSLFEMRTIAELAEAIQQVLKSQRS
jgi:amino acid adenylation domain-containing protein